MLYTCGDAGQRSVCPWATDRLRQHTFLPTVPRAISLLTSIGMEMSPHGQKSFVENTRLLDHVLQVPWKWSQGLVVTGAGTMNLHAELLKRFDW